MKIKDLFVRDIFRQINGVVKADQLDESSVWQELDEFVVTQELDKHFRKFISAFLKGIENDKNTDIGVWVSGFFGSGKSHFIKVLAYLLNNETHSHEGQSKGAVEFFEGKVQDAMLFGDIKRVADSNTDVILFNIDSKADTKAGRDAILAVFLKVLNEMQGYCPDHPHVAHMERYLEGKGKLQTFEDAFKTASSNEWKQERDAYEFAHDHVIEAWCKATGQSEEAAGKWIDGAEEHFSLTVENFCKWVKEYLDTKGPDHRIMFLVDEVGQFIGGDTHLMLNLQTIAEDLGTMCKGQAWIVVTSQEDIDAVLGEMKAKALDFSKIQGRFPTRLSLSGANVDEVIQKRLLAKKEEPAQVLRKVFQEKGDILKNQLTFSNTGMTFKRYEDSDDFVRNYPFVPYQFQLIQRVFEAIRKAGATGLHLARSERSMLDAFQYAGKEVANDEVGVMVPLHRFYPPIEEFLDTAVKRTIDQAKDNPSLKQPIDSHILETLFLIRYVDEIKGNIDNLVTLCLDEIDADRLALRKQIEESLLRLEKETLINRSGENYFFLTNEERDISREIKAVDLAGHEEAKLLGEIIFDDVLKGQRKHRYQANKMDFPFNRLCDLHPVGNRIEGGLVVSVVTPLADEYETCKDDRCILDSTQDDGQVIIRLDDRTMLGREIRAYQKTDKYLRTKDDGTLPSTTKRIHRDLAEENRERRSRLTSMLQELLVDASYFAVGQLLEIKASGPAASVDEALDYLIKNTFSKMSYIKRLNEHPQKEIQAILRSNDIRQQTLSLAVEEGNPQAIEDVRNYIDLCAKASRPIVLYEMVERYGHRPYGWPGDEVLLLVARMLVLQEIQLVSSGAPIPLEKVQEAISTSGKQRRVTVVRRRTTDPQAIQIARGLAKEVFSEMGPDGEDPLFEFLHVKLRAWESKLTQYKPLADTSDYPGQDEIADGLSVIKALLACDESFKCIERFNERKDDLLELADNFHDLEHFYEHQRPTWDKLRKANEKFQLNRMELERDEDAHKALCRMAEILAAPSPYGIIQEAEGLVSTANKVNQQLITDSRKRAGTVIADISKQVAEEVKAAGVDDRVKAACLDPLDTLHKQVDRQESVAHITQAEQEALRLQDVAFNRIEEAVKPPEPEPSSGGDPVEPPKPKIKPRRVIVPAKLVSTSYLESSEDVDGFLDALRSELEEAIRQGERIQIR
jgi:hypothetical protein